MTNRMLLFGSRALCLPCLVMGLVWIVAFWGGLPWWAIVAVVGSLLAITLVGLFSYRGRTVSAE